MVQFKYPKEMKREKTWNKRFSSEGEEQGSGGKELLFMKKVSLEFVAFYGDNTN
jgi:hypothetical protein